jgi:ABC-type lipoprotein export system ATPase subunit
MYRLSNIYKSYDGEQTFVLNNLSLDINKGDFIAIIGKSGSGKTTLINLMSTIDRPTKGYYTYDNINLDKMSNDWLASFRNTHIGVIFQDYNLIPEFTVRENILLPTVFSKTKNPHLDEITEFLGIKFLLNKKAKLLSGGEQQRVAVARAMINQPDLLLADEPTGNLDADNAEQLFKRLKKLNDNGTTVVLVTHDVDFAEKFRNVYLLKDGQLLKQK